VTASSRRTDPNTSARASSNASIIRTVAVADADAHVIWTSWDEGTTEEFSLRWDNGGWVAEGRVSGVDVHYVLRLGPDGRTRQFILFRDLDEPDLWLVTDGQGRWAEMNGAERHELRGCAEVALTCSPSSTFMPIRTLGIAVGEAAALRVAAIDVETLAVEPVEHVYTRLSDRRWQLAADRPGFPVNFDVDDDGLLVEAPGWFRRRPAALP
jgi:hypothetical protein